MTAQHPGYGGLTQLVWALSEDEHVGSNLRDQCRRIATALEDYKAPLVRADAEAVYLALRDAAKRIGPEARHSLRQVKLQFGGDPVTAREGENA
jgi:hypothetical protein